VTAPIENRFEADVIKPHDRTRPIILTNEIAVERLVMLLDEFIAAGALPAL
jgi:hypothetical protein